MKLLLKDFTQHLIHQRWIWFGPFYVVPTDKRRNYSYNAFDTCILSKVVPFSVNKVSLFIKRSRFQLDDIKWFAILAKEIK